MRSINNKIIVFKQQIYLYKFNLLYSGSEWFGSRACKKKNFISPQWLRDLKTKKYPLWRLDIAFSKKKYNKIFSVDDGGWHFTNIKTPEEIQKKLLNYTHHDEYEKSGITLEDLKKKLIEKKVIYDHAVDQKDSKWNSKSVLDKVDLIKMPKYLRENYINYINWIER